MHHVGFNPVRGFLQNVQHIAKVAVSLVRVYLWRCGWWCGLGRGWCCADGVPLVAMRLKASDRNIFTFQDLVIFGDADGWEVARLSGKMKAMNVQKRDQVGR